MSELLSGNGEQTKEKESTFEGEGLSNAYNRI